MPTGVRTTESTQRLNWDVMARVCCADITIDTGNVMNRAEVWVAGVPEKVFGVAVCPLEVWEAGWPRRE